MGYYNILPLIRTVFIISNSTLSSICKEEDDNDKESDDESDDKSDVFICSYFECFTIFQHYISKLYLGCDHDGKATLLNHPSPQTLFIPSKVV